MRPGGADVKYTVQFYEDQKEGSLRSAREVVPLVMELLRPRSVVDVGCGVGTWLSVFTEHGVRDIAGVDGDYVPRNLLMIPTEAFVSADLRQAFSVKRSFDLALSIEVAEHLPPAAAPVHVESLVRLAPVVLFGAAIPFKGGTGHLNEQWPEYWAALFRAHGYVVVDALRPRIWTNDKVEDFYRQDLLIFVRESQLPEFPELRRARETTREGMLSVVHPRVYVGRNHYPLAPVLHLAAWTIRLACGRLKQACRRLLGREEP